MIKACLVGVSGYAGMELARLLTRHPEIRLTMACSRSEAGKALGDLYPFLKGLPGADVEISVFDARVCAARCDVAFLAAPAGTSSRLAPELLDLGARVVDFSADYRLRKPGVYERWYKLERPANEKIGEAVYGLTEIYGAEIARAKLIANPGCYPTAAILGAYAALKRDLIRRDDIIIDAKSGASGAGRKPAVPTLFCEISDNFRPYGAPFHRHTPEIEQECSAIAGEEMTISFVPHIVPMKRGILASVYARLKAPMSAGEVAEIFADVWQGAPWIRVLGANKMPETANVRGSMFCDIGLVVDERTGRLIIFSAIDNLCRGASGQAIANANLMFGLPVDAGLKDLCPLP